MTLEVETIQGNHTAQITRRQAQAWQTELSKLTFPSNERQLLEFLFAARRLAERFVPECMHELLKRFRLPDGPAFVLLRDLPTGVLVPTPKDGLRPPGKDPVSEGVMFGIIELIASIVAFRPEKSGEPSHQVVPIDGETKLNTNSARSTFGDHSDNAFLPPELRQQIIALFGLRNESGAATTLIECKQLLAAMGRELEAQLRLPIVRFPSPTSFNFDGWTLTSPPKPILYDDADGVTRINANVYAMQPVNPVAAEAVRQFIEIVNTTERRRIVLGRGDLLLFRDDTCMHGREAFEGDRWIQRAYGRFDLSVLRELQPQGRVFDVSRLILG